MHASIVAEIMDLINVMSLMISIVLHRTRLSLKRRGTMLQWVVAMVEDVLVLVGIIRAKAIMKGNKFGVTNTACTNHNGNQCFDGV